MAETHCGKSCTACTYKEPLACPGCKNGPGKAYRETCELALCIRNKGHKSCETCSFLENCSQRNRRDQIPQMRIQKQQEEIRRQEALAARAPLLDKWLWILFWLALVGILAGIPSSQQVGKIAPWLNIFGRVLIALISLATGLIFLLLYRVEDRYRAAGICSMILGAANILIALLFGSELPPESLLISTPVAVVGFIGKYNQFIAHSTVLKGLDDYLSEKWEKLWLWYFASTFALLGSLGLTMLSVKLGILVLLAAAIAYLVVNLIELFFLYQTAKLFREYKG